MGATVFLIAQITGISYAHICVVSFLPAILYMASVMFYVHLEAERSDIGVIEKSKIPRLRDVLKKGGHLALPLILLFALILLEYSLPRAALLGMTSVIVVSFFRKSTRLTGKAFLEALKSSGMGMLTLLSAGASAGIILGVVCVTGIGIKFSSIFLSLSGGNLFLMICLIGLASLIFGMGLPIIASYIVLATLAGPALESLGVPVLTAHLVILWFSVDAAVTPPVAITSYVAAGIAEAPIMSTVWEAWKAAKGLYVIPFLMVYTPLIDGNLFQKLEVTLMALFGLFAMTASWKGFLFTRTLLFERLLLPVAALLLFFPGSNDYLPLTHVTGLALFLCLCFSNKKLFRGAGKRG
jgi:TRAP transporter 4TM/12TM fusion protein